MQLILISIVNIKTIKINYFKLKINFITKDCLIIKYEIKRKKINKIIIVKIT